MFMETRSCSRTVVLAIALSAVLAVLPGCWTTGEGGRTNVSEVWREAEAEIKRQRAEFDAVVSALEADLDAARKANPDAAEDIAALEAEIAATREAFEERAGALLAHAERIAGALNASVREDGSIDAVGAVGPLIPFLPPGIAQAALLLAVGANGVQEVVRRRRAAAEAAARAEAAAAERRAREIVSSMDAARKVNPTLRAAMADEATKTALWEPLSPDTFEWIEKHRNT